MVVCPHPGPGVALGTSQIPDQTQDDPDTLLCGPIAQQVPYWGSLLLFQPAMLVAREVGTRPESLAATNVVATHLRSIFLSYQLSLQLES